MCPSFENSLVGATRWVALFLGIKCAPKPLAFEDNLMDSPLQSIASKLTNVLFLVIMAAIPLRHTHTSTGLLLRNVRVKFEVKPIHVT